METKSAANIPAMRGLFVEHQMNMEHEKLEIWQISSWLKSFECGDVYYSLFVLLIYIYAPVKPNHNFYTESIQLQFISNKVEK